MDALRPADSPTGTELSAELHAGCPGHAAYVSAEYYEAYVIDDEDRPEELNLYVVYLCLDADRYGHPHRYRDTPARRPAPPDGGGGDANDAENAAAEWQARQDEARRTERRNLIRLNKEADAAETVRREFLRQCTTVKSRHKAMAAWALSQVVHRDPTYSLWAADYYQNKPTLAAILGADPALFTAAAPATAHGMILWIHVVCAHEEALPRDSHRQVNHSRAAYLSHLHTLSYVLSAVEQQIIDNTTPTPAADTEQPADEQNQEVNAA